MPKVLQCANCRKYFLGGTYTLIKHFEKCIQELPKSKSTISVTMSFKEDVGSQPRSALIKDASPHNSSTSQGL